MKKTKGVLIAWDDLPGEIQMHLMGWYSIYEALYSRGELPLIHEEIVEIDGCPCRPVRTGGGSMNPSCIYIPEAAFSAVWSTTFVDVKEPPTTVLESILEILEE